MKSTWKRSFINVFENEVTCFERVLENLFILLYIPWILLYLACLNPIIIKGDSNPNEKYVLSERALWTMNFDTSIIKIGLKIGKLWAFKVFNMVNI